MIKKRLIVIVTYIAFIHADIKRDCLIDICSTHHVQYIEYCFTDFLTNRKSIIRPVEFLEHDLDNGISFDGSSIPGCMRITKSDMVLMPDLQTAVRKIPWTFDHTSMVRVMCSMHITKDEPYYADPRTILKRELAALQEMGYNFIVGPEIEFYVFDHNAGIKCVDESTYADAFNQISLENNIITVMHVLNQLDLHIEKGHHEVGEGQYEFSVMHDDALQIADALVTAQNALTMLFNNYNKKVSFMPKPFNNKPGSGMHLNFSLYDNDTMRNAFYDTYDPHKLSSVAQSFIAGVLKHAAEITLLLNPTVNSYKRLGGHEAPKFICCGNCNRSALIRLPKCDDNPDVVRAEIRSPDGMCNPYLACAALLKAGMEGIKNNYCLPEIITENLYSVDDRFIQEKGIAQLPQTMQEAIEQFEHSALMQELLGEFLFNEYLSFKKAELAEFMQNVTNWELERYL